jgi:hemolysin D
MSALFRGLFRAKPDDPVQTIHDFQSSTADIEGQPDPFLARSTFYFLAGLLIFGVIWATISHMDRIVSARGKLISTVGTVVVQPLEAAVIKSLEFGVGDVVRAGQVLATLDATFTSADLDQLQKRFDSLSAEIARLEAEEAGKTFVADAISAPELAKLQQSIWRDRREQYDAQLRNYQGRISRLSATLTGRQQEQELLTARLKVLREIENMRTVLLSSSNGTKLNALQATDARIEVARNLSLTVNTINETRYELESLTAERDVYIKQWRSKVNDDLFARRNDRDSIREQLIKAQRRKDLVTLEAPVDGVVLEVGQRSVGSIVKDAEPLFTLVPLNAELEVEATIEARDLGYVGVGDKVYLKLDAYPYMQHGLVEGTVRTISEDAFTTKDDRSTAGSFYKARIKLSEINLRDVPDSFRLIPGMPLTADIKIGSRSIISYLLRPMMQGMSESMREP